MTLLLLALKGHKQPLCLHFTFHPYHKGIRDLNPYITGKLPGL